MKLDITIKIMLCLLLITGMIACRRDKLSPSSINDDCGSFQEELSSMTFFTEGKHQYKAPCFNPTNENEFVYHYRDNEQGIYKIYKFNLDSQIKTEIVESGKIWRQPKWSSSGWIAFTHAPTYVDHIYIVKDNGDSLKQMSETSGNLSPTWSSEGDHLFWSHSPNLGVPYYFLKRDRNSVEIDTLISGVQSETGYFNLNDISDDNLLLSESYIGNRKHIIWSDLENSNFEVNSIVDVQSSFESLNIDGLCWSVNGQYIFVSITNDGIYKISKNGDSKELLIPFCDKKRYTTISHSPNSNYLLGERIDSEIVYNENDQPTGEIKRNSTIYLINLHTLEETKINL